MTCGHDDSTINIVMGIIIIIITTKTKGRTTALQTLQRGDPPTQRPKMLP